MQSEKDATFIFTDPDGYDIFVNRWAPPAGVTTKAVVQVEHGAAILNVVEGAGEPLPAEVSWFLVGATAVVLVSIALLAGTIQVSEENRPINRSADRALFLSSFVILLLWFITLSPIPLLLVLNLLLLAPVFYGFKTWPEMQGAEASVITEGSK